MTSQRENELMLAKILGISEDEAALRLSNEVAITHGEGESALFAREVEDLISRTLTIAKDGQASVELAIGSAPLERSAVTIAASLSGDGVAVSTHGPSVVDSCHPLLRAIAACYVATFTVSQSVGLDKGQGDPFVVRFAEIAAMEDILGKPIVLNDAVLVGAGAIGNGFLRALRHFEVSGSLIVADPKDVSAGNGNRCLYFDEASVGESKARELCKKAQPDFPNLLLKPYPGDLHELVPHMEHGRVRRVFVATDSRRSRRSVQSELPLEVIDASTTAAEEVIVHSHRQPTNGACLACIYRHIQDEEGREKDIAAGLGVTLEDVRKGRIDADAAKRIASQNPRVSAEKVVGLAYDSLFKELCGEQVLLTPGGEQVLAPFGFVSNLAGALMAVELARFDSIGNDGDSTNYFFTDPWRAPHRRARMRKSKVAGCEFCSRPNTIKAMNAVWEDVLGPVADAG